eukprot:3183925-Pleurochrysis_carterae.AAC.1
MSRNRRRPLHNRVTATHVNRPAYRHSAWKRRTLRCPLPVLCETPTLIALLHRAACCCCSPEPSPGHT